MPNPHGRRQTGALTLALLTAAAVTVAASVAAASGAISLNPSALGFGGQQVGTTSSARSVTLTNTAADPLTVHTVGLTGAHAPDYAVVADLCTGATLAPSESCAMSLTFTPRATGARLATLAFTSSAETNPTLSLTGSGTQPRLGVDRQSIAFEMSAVGQSSPSRTLTVSNTGSGPLGPISVAVAGAHPADFAVTANTCTAVYGAGQSCTLTLRATPAADGARAATLVLSSNDPAGPTNVALATVGDGVPPVSTIDNTDMSVLPRNLQALSGTAGDMRAGVAEVVVTYQNVAGGPTTVRPALDCDAARTTCTWRIPAPVVPGVYRVNARASDRVGNLEGPGPQITVIVL